jgi:hypothetical protein
MVAYTQRACPPVGIDDQMTRRRATRPAKPRVPLPRQTGGVHENKSKRPWRERKHKKRIVEE